MEPETHPPRVLPTPLGLKKVQPYWYPYTTMAKLRWQGRELLEVVSSEFRDRSMEYYRYALESGVTTVNGKIAGPETIIKNGDRIENIVHRHEPPVTSTPIKILLHDVEREFIVVDKPGSIPIHGTGRFFKNTLIEILQEEFGFKTYPVNRLDRLTSGLMILPLSSKCANTMAKEFEVNTVYKEYVTRCRGEFPEDEITCEEPLLTVDRQMGLNIVHPLGKPAKTVFKRIRYDAHTNSSVVLCETSPRRTHQIRVHLQFLGYPVANDPVYSETRIWGKGLGKGGIDTTPSDERVAPAPPPHLERQTEANGSPESLTKVIPQPEKAEQTPVAPYPKLLPRETGEDIGLGSPVPLSSEAVGVITQLRNMKDEEEDWGRWRDVIFRAKGALAPADMKIRPVPQNKRRRGKAEFEGDKYNLKKPSAAALTSEDASAPPQPPQFTVAEVVERASEIEAQAEATTVSLSENSYCPECYLPLHPDPKPEKLYIFLHALRYKTSLGEFETPMPEWAQEEWDWDRS
ncbi:pseudouridine synthase [Mycena alexandri]|uniref:Pseudouridine synthase n=1 Tax=Mycena alexandri TaxID=1745969 RepID=A0AAD6STJ3_9AGAR|nr:pseudouridine synthase [Mycena alexandri]